MMKSSVTRGFHFLALFGSLSMITAGGVWANDGKPVLTCEMSFLSLDGLRTEMRFFLNPQGGGRTELQQTRFSPVAGGTWVETVTREYSFCKRSWERLGTVPGRILEQFYCGNQFYNPDGESKEISLMLLGADGSGQPLYSLTDVLYRVNKSGIAMGMSEVHLDPFFEDLFPPEVIQNSIGSGFSCRGAALLDAD